MDLAVGRGEVVAVVGPSGSGKTTLLRLLNGTVLPTAGTVRVDGVDLATMERGALQGLRTRVGVVPQENALVPTLRVVQNVLAGAFGRQGLWRSARAMLLPPRADLVRAHALLERVGIPEKLFHRTDTLSGGQKQRVAIARALHQEPTALLADEPVASVDPSRARDLLRLMTQLAREEDLTLIACMHDLELARAFFPRMVGLRRGGVAFDAPTESIARADLEELYRLEEAELTDG